jgi:hypothetical protein
VQHLDRSTFNNIEHLGHRVRARRADAVGAADRAGSRLQVLPGRGAPSATKFDMGWLTHGDFKSRMEGYQMGRRMGVSDIAGEALICSSRRRSSGIRLGSSTGRLTSGAAGLPSSR